MPLKTKRQAMADLDSFAALASSLGYQVTFSVRTETEGYRAGHSLTEIIISAATEG